MRVLAIDTSTARITTALTVADDENVDCWSQEQDAPNQHGELLALMIVKMLESAGVTVHGLGAVAVGLGPGPFTGLRVGVVTAKAMADALGISAYGECSLDVIAQDYRHLGVPFAVVSDARRKQVYWRRYDAAGAPIGLPSISPPIDLAEQLAGDVDLVVGAGVELYPAAFERFTTTQRVGVNAVGYPQAATLAAMVLDRARHGAPSDDLTPMYLRRPDARPPGAPKQVTPV